MRYTPLAIIVRPWVCRASAGERSDELSWTAMQILGIPVIRVAGVEADDVIGTVASRGIDDGFLVAIASPDKVSIFACC